MTKKIIRFRKGNTCQCKQHHFSDMHSKLSEVPMMLLQRFNLQADRVDLVSSKTRKLCSGSSKPFKRGSRMHKCCGHDYYLLSESFKFIFIRFFFSGYKRGHRPDGQSELTRCNL